MASKKIASIVSSLPSHNPALPRVTVNLNGNDYVLEYDFNAIAVAEELTGLNLFSTFDFKGLNVVKFRAMLFASLLKNHPKITLQEAGSFVTAYTLGAITLGLVEAWTGSRPEVKEDEGNEEAGADAIE